jgi:hypothetical protein
VPVTLLTRAMDIAVFCIMAYLPTDTPQARCCCFICTPLSALRL